MGHYESAWRTENTGSNPVGAVFAGAGWPRHESRRVDLGPLAHESRWGHHFCDSPRRLTHRPQDPCALGGGRCSRGERGERGDEQSLSQPHRRLPLQPTRFTLIRLETSQLRISQLAGSSILWTRAWATLPPAVLYGGAMTSHSPVSSARRSPT